MTSRPVTLALLLATALAQAANAQTIHAPSRIVSEDAVPVRVDGLPAGAEVVVSVARGTNRQLRSTARFRADPSGTVDLARDAPISGDYVGRDPAGLFWSMKPVSPGEQTSIPAGTLRISASVAQKPPAIADIEVLPQEPGVTELPIEGFAGARLFSRPSNHPAPVAILLGGSEGGDDFGTSMVPFVTRQGYAALVLPYYAPAWVARPRLAGLPADFADIPVDRLEAVRDWIASRRDLDAKRIVVIGVSKGGEFAMLAAAHLPWLRAVVGVVPSDVVWEGWGPSVTSDDSRSSFSWHGSPMPWVPYKGMREWLASLQTATPTRLADVHAAGRAANPARVPNARIEVERFRGPMMVVGGGRDATWPSAEMVRNIAQARTRAGLRTEVLLFPGAGHQLSGSGWTSTRAYGDDGTAAATAHGQMEFRARLARFLREVG